MTQTIGSKRLNKLTKHIPSKYKIQLTYLVDLGSFVYERCVPLVHGKAFFSEGFQAMNLLHFFTKAPIFNVVSFTKR